MRESDYQKIRDLCWRLIADCGLKADNILLIFNPEETVLLRVVVEYDSSDLSFAILEQISKVFGTSNINLSCDMGCASDRTHEPYITILNPSPTLIGHTLVE